MFYLQFVLVDLGAGDVAEAGAEFGDGAPQGVALLGLGRGPQQDALPRAQPAVLHLTQQVPQVVIRRTAHGQITHKISRVLGVRLGAVT